MHVPMIILQRNLVRSEWDSFNLMALPSGFEPRVRSALFTAGDDLHDRLGKTDSLIFEASCLG